MQRRRSNGQREQGFFRFMFAGKLAKGIYRLYEYRGDSSKKWD